MIALRARILPEVVAWRLEAMEKKGLINSQARPALAAPSERFGLAHCARQYWYSREEKYCPHEDANDFSYIIHVKENAPELLRRALSRLPVDLVMTGDYQAAERSSGYPGECWRCVWS